MTPGTFRAALLDAAARQDAARMERLSRAQGWAVLRAAVWPAFAMSVRALVEAGLRRIAVK